MRFATATRMWRWWNERSAKGQLYRKSLILVLCITSLPTAIIGVGTYFLGRAHIEHEINGNQQVLFEKSLNRIHGDLSQLELAATQWAIDPRFDDKLRGIDLKEEFNTAYELFRFLSIMKGSYPLIDQVCLYLDNDLPVIVSDTYGIERIPDDAQRQPFAALLHSPRGAMWVQRFPRVNHKGEPGLALVHRLPGFGQPFGALIIYIDRHKLSNMVQDLISNERGLAFMLAGNQEFIVKGEGQETDPRLARSLQSKLGFDDSGDGSFFYTWEGRKYSVSYGELERLGQTWKYVTATPLSEITAPVVIMSRLMLIFSGTVLLAALLLSWVASIKLYGPIRRLVRLFQVYRQQSAAGIRDELEYIEKEWTRITRETRLLQEKLDKAYPSLRDGFLLQLVQGHFRSMTEEELRERMEDYGWETEQGGFVLLLVQLTGLNSPHCRFSENDVPLVTFAASNILQELTETRKLRAAVLNFQDLSVGVLVSYPLKKPREQTKAELFHVSREWLEMLSELLKMQVTVGIGRLTPFVRDIPDQLRELRHIVRFRDLRIDVQVMDMEEWLPVRNEGVNYPFELEKEIIQAVRLGLKDEAELGIERFVEHIVRQSGKENLVQESMQQLLGSILHTILEAGYYLNGLYEGVNLHEELSGLREPAGMARWFRATVLQPYMKMLVESKELHWKRLIETVGEYLRENESRDITLEQCAERFGVNPYTLSRMFKHITGVNFIDYVVKLRIDKAKRMLRDTDLKINDIADCLGYQPSYFIRMFKKYEGMTPGQYRERLGS